MLKKIAVLTLAAVTAFMLYSPATAYAYDELKNNDPEKYYILLDCKNEIVTVFEKDESGEYTKVVRRFICTTGRTELNPLDPEDVGTPTPPGVFKIGGRERFGKFLNFGSTYARYWTQIVGGVYFHSILFSKRDINTLQRSAFRNLGNKVSHGCVRLYVEDAKWLYYYACPGTTIKVTNSEPSNGKMKNLLKTKLSFGEYNELQKSIYDNGELPNPEAWVVKDNADIRTGNGNEDKIVKRLGAGAQVEVLQKAEPWCKVKYDGREGYILTAYLTFENGKTMSGETADIMKSTEWMYSAADDKLENRVVKVPQYSSVSVLSEAGDGWTKVQYWDETGFIQSKYIKKGWGVTY